MKSEIKTTKITSKNGLKFEVNQLEGSRPTVKATRPRGKKFYSYSYYKDMNHVRDFINAEIKAEDKNIQWKKEKRETDKKERAAMAKQMKVGTLLHYSWGYDQTNCEFFEVIEKIGHMVKIRAIGAKTVRNSEGNMCENLVPDKGNFFGDVINKRISRYGVSMDFGSASPCAEFDSFYSSHYA